MKFVPTTWILFGTFSWICTNLLNIWWLNLESGKGPFVGPCTVEQLIFACRKISWILWDSQNTVGVVFLHANCLWLKIAKISRSTVWVHLSFHILFLLTFFEAKVEIQGQMFGAWGANWKPYLVTCHDVHIYRSWNSVSIVLSTLTIPRHKTFLDHTSKRDNIHNSLSNIVNLLYFF